MKDMYKLIIFTTILLSVIGCIVFAPAKSSLDPVTVVIPATEAQKRFEKAMQVVLQHEGGATNDKDDPGGATQWGVSLRFLKQIGYDVDKDGDVDADDIFKLTRTDADKIYLKHFWDKYNFDDIQQLDIAIKLFDTCVNIGPIPTYKLIRATFNEILEEKVPASGPIDLDILYMLNMVYSDVFLEEFRKQQADHYLKIIKANPKLAKYKNGWLKRAAS
jgi:lysozyme family protein